MLSQSVRSGLPLIARSNLVNKRGLPALKEAKSIHSSYK
jgi:hypothetical protein